MGRKRDLKNVHGKRPPSYSLEHPEALNEWGEEFARMTERTEAAQRTAQARQERVIFSYG